MLLNGSWVNESKASSAEVDGAVTSKAREPRPIAASSAMKMAWRGRAGIVAPTSRWAVPPARGARLYRKLRRSDVHTGSPGHSPLFAAVSSPEAGWSVRSATRRRGAAHDAKQWTRLRHRAADDGGVRSAQSTYDRRP